MANKTGKGGFTKGSSGNPGGRPTKDARLRRIEAMARDHSEEALTALVDECKTGKGAPRVSAAIALLDRGWGKPVERQESGDPGSFERELSDEQLDAEITEAMTLAVKDGRGKAALKVVKEA